MGLDPRLQQTTPEGRTFELLADLERRLSAVERALKPDPWHLVGAAGEPAFGTGWSTRAGFEAVAFYKDPLGIVRLRGVLAGAPGAATVAFVLPVGYRPSGVRGWLTYGDYNTATQADVRIDSGGNLYLSSGASDDGLMLDLISFRAV